MKLSLNARVLKGLVQWIDEDSSGDLSVGDLVRTGNNRFSRVSGHDLENEYAASEFLSSAYLGDAGSGRISFLQNIDSDRRYLVYSQDGIIREVRDLTTGKTLPFHETADVATELASVGANLDAAYAATCAPVANDAEALWDCGQNFTNEVAALYRSAAEYSRVYQSFDAERANLQAYYAKTPRPNFRLTGFDDVADAFIGAQEEFHAKLELFRQKIPSTGE